MCATRTAGLERTSSDQNNVQGTEGERHNVIQWRWYTYQAMRSVTPWLAALLLCSIGSAGCGEAEDAADAGPTPECADAKCDDADGLGEFDPEYIIIGSGAGGGPLAARLAEEGKRVLVIEAGEDDTDRLTYQVPAYHGFSTEDEEMQWDYFVKHYDDEVIESGRVPVDPKLACGYRDPDTDAFVSETCLSPVYCESDPDTECEQSPGEELGILYPRSGTLGGCTSHNAMITYLPHESDWERIVELTGDDSWNADDMQGGAGLFSRDYFEKVQDWLEPEFPASSADAALLGAILDDKNLIQVIWSALRAKNEGALGSLNIEFIASAFGLDVNDNPHKEGVYQFPLATQDGERISTATRLRAVERRHSDNLVIWTGTFATRVVFESDRIEGGDPNKAVGVEYVRNPHAYEADPKVDLGTLRAQPISDGEKHQVLVGEGGEVIISAGAFNTPQLLMLSGIGPDDDGDGKIDMAKSWSDDSESSRVTADEEAIDVRVELPWVGKRLQDRYEVGIVAEHRLGEDAEPDAREGFSILSECTLQHDDDGRLLMPRDERDPDLHLDENSDLYDPCLAEWIDSRVSLLGLDIDLGLNWFNGAYATNGVVASILHRSSDAADDPDFFIFGIPGDFRGYYPGYSADGVNLDSPNRFTWAVLEGHTENRNGAVQLRSTDPRRTPEINFGYFDNGRAWGSSGEGSDQDASRHDVQAMVDAIRFVRDINAQTDEDFTDRDGSSYQELFPSVEQVPDEDLAEFVETEAWGHHACCTARMGRSAEDSVLDGQFRVHGTTNLRVVDASIFPEIPGLFIVLPIYMASEKAAEVILDED